jgi:hypothetical protein
LTSRTAAASASGFIGQYDDGFFSLLFAQGPYQNHWRWYDPPSGRYLQPEPTGR